MKPSRRLTRRSFFSIVAGGAAAGSLGLVSGSASGAQGCTDRDPAPPRGDPGGQGRNCQNRAQTGCSDSDPTDPGGRGRNCGRRDGDVYPTGRRERRYEVCWVDHPSRSDDECNIQTYSEWATTYSDGHTEYDTSEAMARRAEMERRGYTARWHRIIVDW